MDNYGVSFQMFLIQLSFTAVGSERQISVDQVTCNQTMSKEFSDICLGRGACAEAQTPVSVKKNCIRHFVPFNFSSLSLVFILKYYPSLHVVKRLSN